MRARRVAVLFAGACGCLSACSGSAFPGDKEEVHASDADVPEAVRAAAHVYCRRLGGAVVEEWFWDNEDKDWEARLSGLTRQAELDILPDGTFSELELVHDFAEVEAALPDVAERLRRLCRTREGLFIELSLRRETYLDDVPELREAWSRSGVVLECQCPGGRDVEIDARGVFVERPLDDEPDTGGEDADE